MQFSKETTFNIWYVVAAVFGVLLIQHFWIESQRVEPIPYSEFERYLDDGKINNIVVGNQFIRGYFKEPRDGRTQFVTTRVDPALAQKLAEKGVRFTGAVESTLLRDILSWVLPILLFFGLWMFVFRRVAEKQGLGNFLPIGKSKAKVYVEKDIKVTFNDVAGVDEAKEELKEVVAFLRAPQEYGRLGARIPKGVLLVGPPGTGKTLLARAIAGEAGVPFLSINGSEFVEMFVGVGAARVRDLFEQARSMAPCIIFIDELDALGKARGAFPAVGGHDEREQTLNQLLVELDGFDPAQGIVLLAATNRPEILDPALLRAGRFDRQVLIDRPDKTGRVQILKVHMRKVTLAEDVDPEKIAALTTGFTGADLANLVNEAALLATRRGASAVAMQDFTAGIERIVAGLEKKNRLLNPNERKVVAYHEMGHALVALAISKTDAVHKVSIIPRGVGALGYTIQRPTEDRYLMTRDELEAKIAVLLGGRAAEKLVFGKLSTGAADDLAKVTDIARNMVVRYGMDETLGYVVYEPERPSFLGNVPGQAPSERQFSETTAEAIDAAVKSIVHAVFDRTTVILTANRDVLERCVKSLLEKETLNEDELRELTRDLRSPGTQAMAAPAMTAASQAARA
ncbi:MULTISPECIES: ATP-dependent zinc metalloprotease FtsH [Bradyrhizobium]|jgi:cell division protease FtsH|uniref:ATP-dependent zinc metalloprotease FtsH n=1 Tax=Bradyrhizobium TaxID=374 RepID=UPI0015562131|nr:ATP-dependent zinc metalloprotease FtsH [Bradyrhizobium sp. LMG 8443]NPU25255.1 ATP-dependent zinc metalloprotease FtsH [Bradyrhizobium sp. LMG 8443]